MREGLTQRQEAFCQEVAKGVAIYKAYEIAGYPPSRSNAYRLRTVKRVAARIDELVAYSEPKIAAAQVAAAERAGVDHYWVIRTLRRNSVLAARRGDTAASNRAAELIGKHLGMFIDKKEIQINVLDDADEYLARLIELVGKPVAEDMTPQLEHAVEDGQEYGPGQEPEPDTVDIIE